jgi:hypothetical protein
LCREEAYEDDEEDMDLLYRNYEILSEFYQKYFVDLRILDLTCDPAVLPAPTLANARVAQYLEVTEIILPWNRREIITVRGQSYVSRLPKY